MLWYFHSETLRGFYASEVYVVAADLDGAVAKAVEEYDIFIAKRLVDYGTDFLTDVYPDDPEYVVQAKACRDAFVAEATDKLRPIPSGAIIFHRS